MFNLEVLDYWFGYDSTHPGIMVDQVEFMMAITAQLFCIQFRILCYFWSSDSIMPFQCFDSLIVQQWILKYLSITNLNMMDHCVFSKVMDEDTILPFQNCLSSISILFYNALSNFYIGNIIIFKAGRKAMEFEKEPRIDSYGHCQNVMWLIVFYWHSHHELYIARYFSREVDFWVFKRKPLNEEALLRF